MGERDPSECSSMATAKSSDAARFDMGAPCIIIHTLDWAGNGDGDGDGEGAASGGRAQGHATVLVMASPS